MARQHRMMVGKLSLEVKTGRKFKTEPKTSMNRKKLTKKNWDRHRDKKSHHEYIKEMRSIAKKEVAKEKEKACRVV